MNLTLDNIDEMFENVDEEQDELTAKQNQERKGRIRKILESYKQVENFEIYQNYLLVLLLKNTNFFLVTIVHIRSTGSVVCFCHQSQGQGGAH